MNNDNTTDKVDYNISDKNRVFGLFSYGKYANPIVGSLAPITTSTLPVPYTDGRGVIEYATLAQLHDTLHAQPHPPEPVQPFLQPFVYPSHQQHRQRELSFEGRAHRVAAGNRQHRLSGHQLQREQRAGELGRNELPCL